MKSKEEFLTKSKFNKEMTHLKIILDKSDHKKLRFFLENIVTGYKPNHRIVDWLLKE
jgi:hypothetical protein